MEQQTEKLIFQMESNIIDSNIQLAPYLERYSIASIKRSKKSTVSLIRDQN